MSGVPKGDVCLNDANLVGFRLFGGDWMAFVSAMAAKGLRLLPSDRHSGRIARRKRGKWEMSV